MPQAADMTIANATPTNKTFTLLAPSAGLSSNAEWALKEGAVVGCFPRYTSQARINASGKSRVSSHKFRMPQSSVSTDTGLTTVGSAFEMNATFTVPDDFPEALRDHAVAYATNLLANAITKAVMRDGVPAT